MSDKSLSEKLAGALGDPLAMIAAIAKHVDDALAVSSGVIPADPTFVLASDGGTGTPILGSVAVPPGSCLSIEVALIAMVANNSSAIGATLTKKIMAINVGGTITLSQQTELYSHRIGTDGLDAHWVVNGNKIDLQLVPAAGVPCRWAAHVKTHLV